MTSAVSLRRTPKDLTQVYPETQNEAEDLQWMEGLFAGKPAVEPTKEMCANISFKVACGRMRNFIFEVVKSGLFDLSSIDLKQTLRHFLCVSGK